MTDIKDIDAQIAALKAQRDKLLAEKRAYDALPPTFRIATLLHQLFCRASHVDVCDWEYDIWPPQMNNCGARQVYSRWAARILAAWGNDVSAVDFLEIVASRRQE